MPQAWSSTLLDAWRIKYRLRGAVAASKYASESISPAVACASLFGFRRGPGFKLEIGSEIERNSPSDSPKNRFAMAISLDLP
jgi:hypothetical protein